MKPAFALDLAQDGIALSVRDGDGWRRYRVEGSADAALADETPGVVVAGASMRGLGLPACVRQGRAAARG